MGRSLLCVAFRYFAGNFMRMLCGEPKPGGNPKGNYEEPARVPQGSPEPGRARFPSKPPILLQK